MKDARKLVEALPDVVRVGGYDWYLEKWNAHQARGASRWGECSTGEMTIRIQLDMPTAQKAVDTLMHEISHAMFWVYGVQDEDKEERLVGALGSGLMALYRDNPWLLDWLRKALHG